MNAGRKREKNDILRYRKIERKREGKEVRAHTRHLQFGLFLKGGGGGEGGDNLNSPHQERGGRRTFCDLANA